MAASHGTLPTSKDPSPQIHLHPSPDSMPSSRPSLASRRSTSTLATATTSYTASSCVGGPRSPGLSVAGSYSTQLTSPPQSPGVPPEMSFPSSTKPKKKKSFLGSLFAKEPSTDAFLQMQQQAQKKVAQPSRKMPPALSGVSTTKIPEHVPKVNSRWNGMPQRYQESTMHFLQPSSNGSESSNLSERRRSYQQPPSSSNSSSNVGDLPVGAGARIRSDDRTILPPSIPLTEKNLLVNSSAKKRTRPASMAAQSPPHERNPYPIASYFPSTIHEPRDLAQMQNLRLRSSMDQPRGHILEGSPSSSLEGGEKPLRGYAHSGETLVDTAPYSNMPDSTRLRRLDPRDMDYLQRRSPMLEDKQLGTPRPSQQAFLAGEAQPVQLPEGPPPPTLILPHDQLRGDVDELASPIGGESRTSSRPRQIKKGTKKPVAVCPWEGDENLERLVDTTKAAQARGVRAKSFGFFK